MRHSLCLFAVLLSSISVARAADWPAFRGPQGNGWSNETNVPTEWSTDKNIKWKVPLAGEGNGSPIVVGDRVFVSCAQDQGKKNGLYCFDRASGSERWSRIVNFDKVMTTHKTNPYCSPTPVSDGKRVIVWHGTAGLYCYDIDGNELWKRDDLGEFVHIWGYASSPVIYKDRVVQNCGPGAKPYIAAFDLTTGRDIWRVDEPQSNARGWRGSWTTPILVNLEGQDQLVCYQASRVVSYKPDNGEILWFCNAENKKGDLAYSSVMISDGLAMAQGGFSGGGMAFKLGGSGDISANRIWHKPSNPQSIGTGVIIDGYLYIPDAGPSTIRCIEMATGTVKWQERAGNYWGSIVMADGRAYVTDQDGSTTVFKPSPEKLDIVAQNALGEHCNATPAISNGQIFIRTYNHLWCVEEAKSAE